MVENQQIPKIGFDNLLRLHIHAVIKETGQIYQREQYILIEPEVITNMVREKKRRRCELVDFIFEISF